MNYTVQTRIQTKVRIFALLACCLGFLAACGFTPLYGQNGVDGKGVTAQFNDIQISNIPDRSGQILRNALIDRFYTHGRPVDATYTLNIPSIKETVTDLDITKNSDATRAQLILETSLILLDNQSGKAVLKRNLHAITSYNILQSQFTTRISEQSARENALQDLARQVEMQLGLYFKRAQ